MTRSLSALYARAPHRVRAAALTAYAWRNERTRYGGRYPALFDEVVSRDAWTTEQMFILQQDRLVVAARRAAETPYWRRIFTEAGLSPEEAASPEIYATLPVMTKADLQEDLPSFSRPARDRTWAHTSGTTGAGLRFRTTRTAQQEQWAVWWRYRGWHGLRRGEWCGYFGGRPIVPIEVTQPPFWETNRPARQVLFSNYHLREDGVAAIVGELRRLRLPWLHGYPSALSLVANFIVAHELDLGYAPRVVTTGAESLLPAQRHAIGVAFGVDPVEHYGCAEGVANASQCPGGALHVDEDFARMDVGPSGNVIGTALSNPATMFFRYEMSDQVELSTNPCECGLPGRVITELSGRSEDYLALSDESLVGRIDHVFKDLTAIREAQVIQRVAGEAEVLVAPNGAWSDADDLALRSAFESYFGSKLHVQIRLVDRVPRTGNGKLKLVRRLATDEE